MRKCLRDTPEPEDALNSQASESNVLPRTQAEGALLQLVPGPDPLERHPGCRLPRAIRLVQPQFDVPFIVILPLVLVQPALGTGTLDLAGHAPDHLVAAPVEQHGEGAP